MFVQVRINPVVRDFFERAATAALIGVAVAYESGARDHRLLVAAGIGALVSFVKNSSKSALAAAKAAPVA